MKNVIKTILFIMALFGCATPTKNRNPSYREKDYSVSRSVLRQGSGFTVLSGYVIQQEKDTVNWLRFFPPLDSIRLPAGTSFADIDRFSYLVVSDEKFNEVVRIDERGKLHLRGDSLHVIQTILKNYLWYWNQTEQRIK